MAGLEAIGGVWVSGVQKGDTGLIYQSIVKKGNFESEL